MMETEKIFLDFGEKRRVKIEAIVCRNIFSRARGLMFRRCESSPALVFKFGKFAKEAIHSFFVFFPFVAVWLGSDRKILEIRKVYPFSAYVCPKEKFVSLVEIPFNRKYMKILDDIERFK